MSSFSKILAPGLRLGYVVAPPEAIELLARLKQATDLQTSTLTQRAAARVLRSGILTEHLPRIREIYAVQCAAMLEALEIVHAGRGQLVAARGRHVRLGHAPRERRAVSCC